MLLVVLIFGFLAFAGAHIQSIPSSEYSDDNQSVSHREDIHQKLLHIRKTLLSRLDRCTLWRDGLSDERKNQLHNLLIRASFEKFRELALLIAREVSPKDEDCLKSVGHLIKKYNRMKERSRRVTNTDVASHIEEFLSPRQISELHAIYVKMQRKDEIVRAADRSAQTTRSRKLMRSKNPILQLLRYFEGMPIEKKQALIEEFFAYKTDLRRRPRHVVEVSSGEESNVAAEDPEDVKPDWLAWMNHRQKNLVERMKSTGSDKWEVMTTIADQYYHQRKDIRRKFDRNFQEYCSNNLKEVLGNENFAALENMFLDNDPVDQIETRFHEMVGDLRSEKSRVLADKYGSFCRKIFRLVHFEPTDLTTWLNSRQKMELGDMISDPDIGDQQVYEKVYEFFEAASGEQKEEATDTIDTGCRHFIAHMLGDDTAEELEDMKLQGNVSTQQLAARLAKHTKEISNERDRRRAEHSLPMCTRIYLNYNGSCDCNGHATTCDKLYHTCQNCSDFTFGVQCEQCVEGFSGNPLTGGCTVSEVEEAASEAEQSCECNSHSSHCDDVGKCLQCQHNTSGDNCEFCAVGFYGDSTKGGADDCSICPCPDGGACFINDDGLVQCSSCPEGLKGVTCEKKDTGSSESSEEDNRF